MPRVPDLLAMPLLPDGSVGSSLSIGRTAATELRRPLDSVFGTTESEDCASPGSNVHASPYSQVAVDEKTIGLPEQYRYGMQQINDFADERNKGWCVYCGGSGETGDHVPSRVFLDEPFPENLPVVPACKACNSSFSKDEEYVACLVECALTGSVEGATSRKKIGRVLCRSEALRSRLGTARSQTRQGAAFAAEVDRVRSVVLKLARGHVAFEQNEPQLDEPQHVSFIPFAAMNAEQRARFEAASENALLPEVGSRGMIRLFKEMDVDPAGWIVVQPGLYRYRVVAQGGYRVQVVLREYLAIEVAWG